MTSKLPNGAQAVDQMDEALCLVRVCWLALLSGSEDMDGNDVEALAFTLGMALRRFGPIREKLNQEDAAVPARVHVHEAKS